MLPHILDMNSDDSDFRALLFSKLDELKKINPKFSMRSFARKLGLSASMTSELMNGKKQLTSSAAGKISASLNLSPAERAILDRALGMRVMFGRRSAAKPMAFSRLNEDQCRMVADWYHFAILSLAEVQGFEGTADWIAARLGIAPGVAAEAIERLERLQCLRRDFDGRLCASGEQYCTTDEIPSDSVRLSHLQDFELAKKSLETRPVSERDFIGMTMAVDPDRLPEAKRMSREFRDRLCAFLEGGTKKEVFRLCVSLFPMSQMKGSL